jgi:HEAT repeat protein
MEVVIALGKIKDERAITHLVSLYNVYTDYLNKKIQNALLKINTELTRFYYAILNSDENKLLEIDNAFDLAIEALYQKNNWVRRQAIWALMILRDYRAVTQIMNALNDKDLIVVSYAIYALGEKGDNRAVMPLIDVLLKKDFPACRNGGSPKLPEHRCGPRSEAAVALGKIKDKRALKPLIMVIEEKGCHCLIEKSTWALIELGDERAIEPLKSVKNHTNSPSVVQKAIDRTSIMNESNMMGEYIKELKTIEPAIFDEPVAKPHIEDKERKEAAPKPIEPLKPVTEKKPKRKPIRLIPVYVGGLSLIFIIAGHFYYQGGKKETKTLYLAQKKQPKTETRPEYRDSVPSNDTGDQQDIAPLPSETPASPLPIQQDSLTEESKELVDKEPIKDQAETAILLSKEDPNVVVEKAPSLSKESTPSVIEGESAVPSAEKKDLKVLKEKAPVKESASVRIEEEARLTERAEAGGTLQADPSEDKTKSVAPLEASDSLLKSKKPIEKKFPSVKETAKAEKEEKIIQADTGISSSRIATISKAQTTAPAKKEKAPVAKVEEEQQPKILAPEVSVHKETLSAPEQQETVGPEDKQTLDTQVNEDAAIKLQHIDSNVTQLTRAVAAFDEKKQTDYKPLILSHVEKTKLNTPQDKTQPDNYTVSLHYTSEKNKELMEYLAILLQLEGFDVLGIEKVDYQNSDIRYFHSEDKAGAFLLQKYSTKFITPFMNLEDTNIKIKDLSQKYPNARKGMLEIWLNNNF